MKKHANGSATENGARKPSPSGNGSDESLVEFNRLYNELQVEFDSYNGEAFYNDKMDKL